MVQRKKFVTALAITLIVTLVVAVSTEGIRNYMLFSWKISEGDEFVYDVSVTGYYRSGASSLPLNLAPLNNTQVRVEIISLHNISLFITVDSFSETVIDHEKTDTTYADGTRIHVLQYHEINTLASSCFLPRGSWSRLGSFYPDQFLRPENTTIAVESFFAYEFHQFFIIGFVSYADTAESGWFGYVSPETGVPLNMTSWAWSSTDLVEYSYVMTLTSAS
ncbi:MAG: hypothetical protein RTU63_08900 [Candidatus Thorarchaeota archaeon]